MRYKKILFLLMIGGFFLLLTGCSDLTVLDPKGPVGQSQKDLIVYSLWFMLGIVVVVFVLFGIMVIKYRDRPGRGDKNYNPEIHGNLKVEILWTAIPLIIVMLLSVPTVETLFDLEKPPESSNEQEPLVIHATSADWKWFFSYPEQNIETVNYLHIPTDRAIEFRLTSADSMAALWIPALGGQKYNMAGMETTLYLQADEEGVYDGRNSNFNGEGFSLQTFKVHAEPKEEFNNWVDQIQNEKPELTQNQYNELLKPGILGEMAFSNTHLEWVDHSTMRDSDYSLKHHLGDYEQHLHIKSLTEYEKEGEDHES
ncbi:cytochrome aa3 quinol oxidase subunit II [Aquisalibacillus elongatus]|uniref:Quinol oxidase subunit 2 n=1 Tax=Aquisalibacillus elongatus TaxID=485577 RepID=A0A3N5BTZ9_9BACI|nr:cytochrome aa3 quinol oxidase subunit II [Aquisalibacillus elongatus]RPF53258.1 cytochrome aa3 quinol oxidase subunit 2 [Aquisalibacillus elongatus]